MRGRDPLPVEREENRGMAEMVKNAVADAIGQGTDKVVVQASRGGGASNESNVEVTIEKLEVHVHEGGDDA